MADARELWHEPAHGFLRPRRATRGGGHHDQRVVSVGRRVVVYHAAACSLCERALEVVETVRRDVGFELELVDIGGDSALESRYRELLPVVEIDGERAFTYFVDEEALRARLER